MGTRIEVWRDVKFNGLRRQRTLLSEMQVDDSGVYQFRGSNFKVSEETKGHSGNTFLVLEGQSPRLRMHRRYDKREIALSGDTGVQRLRYNREIVVYRTQSKDQSQT